MYNSPYKTVLQCATGVYRTEGYKAFYRSYITQLCMNLPHQTIHFTTYELFQNKVNINYVYDTKINIEYYLIITIKYMMKITVNFR